MMTPTIAIFRRSDRAFELACRRLPERGRDLVSQPTLSRLENTPVLRDVIGLTYAFVDKRMASYDEPPSSVTLAIDDTCDIARNHLQFSLFNAHSATLLSADPCL